MLKLSQQNINKMNDFLSKDAKIRAMRQNQELKQFYLAKYGNSQDEEPTEAQKKLEKKRRIEKLMRKCKGIATLHQKRKDQYNGLVSEFQTYLKGEMEEQQEVKLLGPQS
jgi:hypothetical protein